MKIEKIANGKRKIKISKKEWESMGRTAHWLDTPKMMPGQEPYSEEEYKNLQGLVSDAADGDPGELDEPINKPLGLGDPVKLKEDVLLQHSKSVPAHMGYTKEQFAWRKTLNELEGKVGEITRVFPNSKHVNVDFDGHLIGIDIDQLERA